MQDADRFAIDGGRVIMFYAASGLALVELLNFLTTGGNV